MEERKHKNHFWKGALFGALAIFIAGCAAICAAQMLGFTLTTNSAIASGTQQKLSYFEQLVNSYYLYSDEVTDEQLQDGVYSGYVNALGDVYSEYFDAEETASLMESVKGEYSGIGVVFSQNLETMISTAVQVYKNSPAEEAGVKVNDILYKVNGKDITSQKLSDVVTDIRGEEGTTVELTVLRGEDLEEITMTVTRRTIQVETVTQEMKDDKIGYIRITEFDQSSVGQFESALLTLEEQGMEGLVVDLRANPGGELTSVTDILDLLLPEGLIVYMEDKYGNREEYKSDAKHCFDKPMVVLVDGNSASASEIFAGAIQDYKIGTIVGTQTYGKGIVQQIFPLSDDTAVKMTIAEYFTPKGRSIHGIGVKPDVEVPYEWNEENPDLDNQLDEAIEVLKKLQ